MRCPSSAPEQVLAEYRQARGQPDFDLRKFVAAHFTPPPQAGAEYHTVPGQDVREHIDALWKVLERKPEDQRPYSSRLALPHRYVVPGGRFNEIYYWDSYFTMLGLEESGRHDLTVSMLDNFAWLIDQYGHVPNGNRSYYLSRSQPPFFAAMVELAAQRDGDATYRKYLPQLRREYAVLDGGRELRSRPARRIVASCGCATARCSIATGTIATRRARKRIARTWRRRATSRAPGRRGLSQSASCGGKRLGLQLALARGRQDARHDSHDRFHSARSQQPAVSAGADDRERLRSHLGRCVREGHAHARAQSARPL